MFILFTGRHIKYKNYKFHFMIFEYFPVQRYHTHKYLWYFCTDLDDKQ